MMICKGKPEVVLLVVVHAGGAACDFAVLALVAEDCALLTRDGGGLVAMGRPCVVVSTVLGVAR